MPSFLFSKSRQSKLLGLLLAQSLLVAAMPLEVLAAQYKLESIDYNPTTQSLLLKSSGPVQATVNAVNIGKSKRIILDIEDAELGTTIPRDPVLLQQLTAKWSGIKNISVNQFGGSDPVVRVLLDVEGTNYSPSVNKTRTPLVELKIAPTVAQQYAQQYVPQATVAKPSTVTTVVSPGSSQPVAPSQPSALSLQELKRTLVTINQKYDQLLQENQSLKLQLNQASQNKQDTTYTQSELTRLREANQSLQVQMTQMFRDQGELKKQLDQKAALEAQLSSLQSKVNTLQSQNTQLNTQLTQAKAAPGNTSATASKPATTTSATSTELASYKAKVDALQKQAATLTQENAQLKSKALKPLPPSTVKITDPQLAEMKKQVDTAKDALNKSIATINNQNQEIASLRRQVEQTRSGIDASSKDQLTALSTKLDGKDVEIRTLEEQLNLLRTQLQDAQNKPSTTAETENKLVMLQQQLLQKDEQLGQMGRQLSEMQTRLQMTQSAQASPNEAESLRQQLTQLQAQYKTTVEEYNKQQADYKESVAKTKDLSLQIGVLHDQFKEADERYQKALLAFNNAQTSVEAKKREEQTAQALLDRDSQIKKLLADKQQAKLAAEKQATELVELKADLKKAQAASQAASLTASKADSQLAKENKRLQGVVDLLKRDNQMLATETQAKSQKQALQLEWEAKLKAALAENAKLSEDLKIANQLAQATQTSASKPVDDSEAQSQIKKLTAEINSLKQDKENLIGVNQSLFTEVSELKKSTGSDKAASSTPVNPDQLVALNNQISDLQTELDGLRRENSALKQANPTVANASSVSSDNAAVTALKKQLADIQAKLMDTDARYKKVLADYDKAKKQQPASASVPPASKELASVKDQLKKAQDEIKRLNNIKMATTTTVQPVAMPVVASTSSETAVQAEKHYKLGQDFETNKQKDLALEEYQRALNLDPANARYVYAVAAVQAAQQEYPKAIRMLQDYIDANPTQVEAYNQLGKAYLLSGQVEDAKQAFGKAISVTTLNNYATTLKKLGKLNEAERVFRTAVDINPYDSELRFNLGNIYNATNNLQDAKESYSQALNINPQFAEAHYNLGLVFSKMGDKQSAVTHLEKFLELSPNAGNADVIRNYVKKLRG